MYPSTCGELPQTHTEIVASDLMNSIKFISYLTVAFTHSVPIERSVAHLHYIGVVLGLAAASFVQKSITLIVWYSWRPHGRNG